LEYKLNKIDTEIRAAINEQTSEGRIHAQHSTELNSERSKDNMQKESKKEKKKQEAFNISKYIKKNNLIEVRAYKSESIEVPVEKEEENNKGSDKGLFIDIRR
jgi:hypothetical protein